MDMDLSTLIARAREAGLDERTIDLAEQGDVTAQFKLGWSYGHGEVTLHTEVEKDVVQAVAWYRKAADQGNAEAQFALGVCCRDGVGIIQNHEDAYRWLLKGLFAERASDSFFAWGFRDGEGVGKDPVKTIAWLRKRAEEGRASAQYDLGRCYQYGAGVERDLAEAGAWYNKMYPESFALHLDVGRRLNTLYDDCSDDDTETVTTVALYRKGAEQGLASAQYHLGRCYQYGAGVERDLVEAGAWYRKAIKGNLSGLQTTLRDYDWEDTLNTLYDDCPDDDTETVETVALYRKGAEQGLASAQYHLGRCYQYGAGVERDLVEAGAWYRKAIDAGIGWRVDDNLNTLYDDCSDDDTETVETVALYRKGAEQGLGSAQYHLGRCYQYGAGVERDLVEAAAWYQKAAEQRIFNAAYELGVMYANARGVPKDDAEAVRWYRFAAGQGSHAKAKHNLKVMYADGRAVPEDEDEDGWKHDDATIDF